MVVLRFFFKPLKRFNALSIRYQKRTLSTEHLIPLTRPERATSPTKGRGESITYSPSSFSRETLPSQGP